MEFMVNDEVTFVKSWTVGLWEIPVGTEGRFVGEHGGHALVTVDTSDFTTKKEHHEVVVWVPFFCIEKLGEVKGYYVSCVAEVLLEIPVAARSKEEAERYTKEVIVASADALRDGIKENDIFPSAVMSTEIREVIEE